MERLTKRDRKLHIGNSAVRPGAVATRHLAAVRYWVEAAREQSRWFVQLRRAYRAETHGKRRGQLYNESVRCLWRVKPLMDEARRMRAVLTSSIAREMTA